MTSSTNGNAHSHGESRFSGGCSCCCRQAFSRVARSPRVAAVALEFFERTAELVMDAAERVAQDRAERLRRIAADDGRQKGKRSLLAPEQQIAEPQAVDAARRRSRFVPVVERIAHEILDGGEHAGDHVRILTSPPRPPPRVQAAARSCRG